MRELQSERRAVPPALSRSDAQGATALRGANNAASDEVAAQGFDGVLLELLARGASEQAGDARVQVAKPIEAKEQATRDGAGMAVKRGASGSGVNTLEKVKALATTAAEQELAGAATLSPTGAAEQELTSIKTDATGDAAGDAARAKQSAQPRVSRETQARGDTTPGAHGAQADQQHKPALVAAGASGAAERRASDSALRALAVASRAVQPTSLATGLAIGLTGGAAVQTSGAVFSRQASPASSGQQVQPGGNAGDGGGGASGGARAHTKPEPLKDLSNAGSAARAKAVKQSFEQAATHGLALALKEGGGTALVKLAPEQLGQLSIKMTVDEGEVTLHARTQTDTARDLLMESVPALREALEAKGLHMRELRVQGPENAENVQDARVEAAHEREQDASGSLAQDDGKGGAFDQQAGSQQGREDRSPRKDALMAADDNAPRAERDEQTGEALAGDAVLEARSLQWIA